MNEWFNEHTLLFFPIWHLPFKFHSWSFKQYRDYQNLWAIFLGRVNVSVTDDISRFAARHGDCTWSRFHSSVDSGGSQTKFCLWVTVFMDLSLFPTSTPFPLLFLVSFRWEFEHLLCESHHNNPQGRTSRLVIYVCPDGTMSHLFSYST